MLGEYEGGKLIGAPVAEVTSHHFLPETIKGVGGDSNSQTRPYNPSGANHFYNKTTTLKQGNQTN